MKQTLTALLAVSLLASCQKEEKDLLKKDDSSENIENYSNELQSGWSDPFRKLVVDGDNTHFSSEIKSCAPNDVVITAPGLEHFDRAIYRGSIDVATFFQDDNIANTLIPHWDAPNFKEYKSKILSGEYTFIKESLNNTILYYLVHEDETSTQSFEHVLLYRIEN